MGWRWGGGEKEGEGEGERADWIGGLCGGRGGSFWFVAKAEGPYNTAHLTKKPEGVGEEGKWPLCAGKEKLMPPKGSAKRRRGKKNGAKQKAKGKLLTAGAGFFTCWGWGRDWRDFLALKRLSKDV